MFYYKQDNYPEKPEGERFEKWEITPRTAGLILLVLTILAVHFTWTDRQDVKKTGNEIEQKQYEFFATIDEENFIQYLKELDKSQVIDISIMNDHFGMQSSIRKGHFTVTYKTSVVKAEGKLKNIEIERIYDFDEYIKFIGSQDIEIIDISIEDRDFSAILVYKKK